MPRMHHNNFDFLAYLKEVHTDLYMEDADVGFRTSPFFPYDEYLEEGFALASPPSYGTVPILFPQATFPIHLLAHIFRFLDPSQDACDLLSCMKTCRLWYLPAQMRLYESIVVRDERSLFLLWEKLSALPHLSHRVHEVHIRDIKGAQTSRGTLHSHWDNPLWLLHTPARLASFVPYAKFLSFEQINWHKLRIREDLPSLRWLSQWTLFSPLRQLSLSSCAFSCFHEFELVMMSLPKLDHLYLDSVFWGDHAAAEADALRSDRRREKLSFGTLTIGRHCDIHSIVVWILATSTLGNIKKLDILAGHEAAPEVIVPFINRFRDTLEYLTIGCEGMRQTLGSTVTLHTNFHAWPNLHTYHLKLTSMAIEKMNWVFISLARALPSLAPPYTLCPLQQCTPTLACPICANRNRVTTLHTIVFEINLAHPFELDNPIWDQVMWLLTSLVAEGRGVRKIVVVQRGMMPFVQAEYVIKKRMGLLSSIVEVRTDWDQ